MKCKKQLIILVIAMIFCSLATASVTTAYAEKSKQTNIEKMTQKEMQSTITDLIDAAINHKNNKIVEYKDLFTEDALKQFRKNIVSKEIINGDISEKAIDIVTPDNSDTFDTVLMCNIRLTNNSNQYNNICMFEFHINKDGKIYGCNVWTY